jgi:hypothetical protein
MILVYKVRDAIQAVQQPWMSGSEWQARPGRSPDAKEMDEEDLRYAYNMRLRPVNDARQALYVELLEVEAIWGTVLKDAARRLSDVYAELVVYGITAHIEMRFGKERDEVGRRRAFELVFNAGEAGAKFRRDLDRVVEEFEAALRPHLRRGPLPIVAAAAAALRRVRKYL